MPLRFMKFWVQFAIIGGLLVASAAYLGILKYLRSRPSPEEIERRRRLEVNDSGKVGSGEITDVDGSLLIYSYTIAGVEYMASQDVSALEQMLPGDPMKMIGTVGIKFDPRNPANSIVICEKWSGIGRPRT